MTRDIRPLVLLLISEKSHARRRKLRFALRLRSSPLMLTPLLLRSEKSHAAVRLLVCKQTRDGSLLLPTFFGIRRLGSVGNANDCKVIKNNLCDGRITNVRFIKKEYENFREAVGNAHLFVAKTAMLRPA